jgi:hypothetical protein
MPEWQYNTIFTFPPIPPQPYTQKAISCLR